jgi:hypothetical protein
MYGADLAIGAFFDYSTRFAVCWLMEVVSHNR